MEIITNQAFRYEDIIANYRNPDKRIVSELWPMKKGTCKRLREIFEWLWYTRLEPFFCRILSIVCLVFSLLIILGEVTLFIDIPVGLFPLIFQNNYGPLGTQVLCLIPLTYILVCSYIGLFRLKLKGRYGLYKNNHTDPGNLCWSSFIMARLTPPLCYNFLMFIKVDESIFNEVYGILNLVPILGKGFSVFFPSLLVVFALLNYFNVFSRIMGWFGLSQYTFSDSYDDDLILEGKSLLAKSRMDKFKIMLSYDTDANNEDIKPINVDFHEEEKVLIKPASAYERIKNKFMMNDKQRKESKYKQIKARKDGKLLGSYDF